MWNYNPKLVSGTRRVNLSIRKDSSSTLIASWGQNLPWSSLVLWQKSNNVWRTIILWILYVPITYISIELPKLQRPKSKAVLKVDVTAKTGQKIIWVIFRSKGATRRRRFLGAESWRSLTSWMSSLKESRRTKFSADLVV